MPIIPLTMVHHVALIRARKTRRLRQRKQVRIGDPAIDIRSHFDGSFTTARIQDEDEDTQILESDDSAEEDAFDPAAEAETSDEDNTSVESEDESDTSIVKKAKTKRAEEKKEKEKKKKDKRAMLKEVDARVEEKGGKAADGRQKRPSSPTNDDQCVHLILYHDHQLIRFQVVPLRNRKQSRRVRVGSRSLTRALIRSLTDLHVLAPRQKGTSFHTSRPKQSSSRMSAGGRRGMR